MTTPPGALRELLTGVFDYAGLFPPASLPLDTVVANYSAYRRSENQWGLGALVVPVNRLRELAAQLPPTTQPLRVNVLASAAAEADELKAVSRSLAGRVSVEAIELRTSMRADLEAFHPRATGVSSRFVELPERRALGANLDALKAMGVNAKIRTGGVLPTDFPGSYDVAEFIMACVQRDLPFKATAGLHHPFTAIQSLTYEQGAKGHRMFGFVNVLMATAFARQGMDQRTLGTVLDETEASAFAFDAASVTWKGHVATSDSIAGMRSHSLLSIGSCSFTEPFDDLRKHNLP